MTIIQTSFFKYDRVMGKGRRCYFKNLSSFKRLIYMPIWIFFHTDVTDGNILAKFEFEHSRAKVKVTVAVIRKTLSSL